MHDELGTHAIETTTAGIDKPDHDFGIPVAIGPVPHVHVEPTEVVGSNRELDRHFEPGKR